MANVQFKGEVRGLTVKGVDACIAEINARFLSDIPRGAVANLTLDDGSRIELRESFSNQYLFEEKRHYAIAAETAGEPPHRLQLYMASVMKMHILQEHDFYVLQTDGRVLAQFRDLENEATDFANAEYEKLIQQPADEDADLADLAAIAHDRAVAHYGLLADLRQRVILGALAGLYHAWEKELRDFIERELISELHSTSMAEKEAWSGPITNVFDLLTDFGWPVRDETFYPLIEACGLIVNVLKHGKGRSLKELSQKYPAYLEDPLGLGVPNLLPGYLDHTLLKLSDAQYNEIAGALRNFWEAFPERLFLTLPIKCDV